MVHGYCIFGGWMIASATDFIFASEDALILALPYPASRWAVTWELGARRTKEILYENRFITAREAMDLGFVNRAYSFEELERETLAYANRVAENDPLQLRDLKLIVNQTLDGMGFTTSVVAAFNGYNGRTRPQTWGNPADGLRAVPYARLVGEAPGRSGL